MSARSGGVTGSGYGGHPYHAVEGQQADTGKFHRYLMDFNTCAVYCLPCQTYVYDDLLDQIVFCEQYNLDFIVSRLREPMGQKVMHLQWQPSEEDRIKIRENSNVVICTGLRGLYNLGNTCFMNSVLQVLVHNPLLKAHFLSDKHSRCPRAGEDCMACEFGILYSEFFSNVTSGFVPNNLLYTMWAKTKMSGYDQKDAHEFFISFLDQLHLCSLGEESDCKCIVHTSFGGVLQSDVTCGDCKEVSVTYDPILDLSLELKSGGGEKSLDDCLQKFTIPETLDTYRCKKCDKQGIASKQLSMKQLPPTLAIQLKRFKQENPNLSTVTKKPAAMSKNTDTIKIPAILDMTQHTTRSVHAQNMMKPTARRNNPYETTADGIPSYKYSLLGMVSHEGNLNTGHYRAFARVRNAGWFKFDDEKVTMTTLDEVLKNKDVYMLFYMRTHGEYSPSDVLDTLESAAVQSASIIAHPDLEIID